MRASDWEFRHRFWVILAVFTVAVLAYTVDPHNAGMALLALARRARGLAGPPADGAVRALFLAAALVAVLGAALRTWAAAYLRTEVVHDAALHADRVVADGPYRHLRNPLYVGLLLAAVAFAPAMSRAGALLLIAGIAVVTLRLIAREEEALAASGGESYARFRAAVPRLLPAISPRLPPSGARPRWGQALLGETFFWTFPVALAVFAFTLDGRVFPLVVGGGLLLRGVLANLWWRRATVPPR